MADYVYELMAKIGLDDAEYQRKLREDGKLSKNTSAELYAAATRMKQGMLLLTGAGIAAVGAFAVSSVKTAGEFDVAMSQVAATMGTTVDEIDELREKALEMGKSTKYTASQAAEGLNILAMSGYKAEDSIAMIEDVLHLAAAGGMDLASAAGYISGAMKGFNDETKDSQYYADLMAKGATLANTSVSQLGEALADSAAVAASYNQSADSVTLSLLRLAEQGETGSAAGTALAAAMKNLYSPTDQAKKKLEELGVAVYDADGKQRDFNDVVNDLQASMDGLTEEEKTANAQLIFGIQGFNAYNKMVVTSTDKQNEWAAALAGSTGAAEQQYETMTDNLQGDIDKLKSAFEGFKIEVGEKLMPVLRRFIKGLTGVFDKLDTILPIVAGLATAFGVFAVAINIGSIIKKVTLAFQAFNLVLAANPIGLLIALIAGLVVAIVALWNNNEEFRNKVIEIWTAIKDFVTSAVERIKTIFNSFKDTILTTANAIKTGVLNKWNEIKTGAINAWETIRSGVQEKVEAVRNAIEEKLNAARAKVEEIVGKIKEKFEELKTKISNVAQKIRDAFKFNFQMPHIKMPHLSITYEPAPAVIQKFLGIDQVPHFSVSWYRKAMENPYLFTKPTLMGFGDGAGDEMVYGHENLLNDIREATGGSNAAVEAKLDQLIELMEDIVQNGLNANLNKTQVYRTINDENRKRSRATNYNSLAMA